MTTLKELYGKTSHDEDNNLGYAGTLRRLAAAFWYALPRMATVLTKRLQRRLRPKLLRAAKRYSSTHLVGEDRPKLT